MKSSYLEVNHKAGLAYGEYVRSRTPQQEANWKAVYDRAKLTEAQRGLDASFTRRIHVLALTGIWCGDCVQQCPLLARIAEANPQRIDVRFVDRDQHADLSERIRINDGLRVPTAIFMAEDFHFLALLGDRTLTRYRAVASRQLGPACPLPGAPVPPEEGWPAATVLVVEDDFTLRAGVERALAANGFGDHSPEGFSLATCLVTEGVLTFLFLLVIVGARKKGAPAGFAGLAIGLCLALIHLVSIPVTNTSVNPARSTGVGVFAGSVAISQLWLFWIAPIAGGLLGGVIYRWLGHEGPDVTGVPKR